MKGFQLMNKYPKSLPIKYMISSIYIHIVIYLSWTEGIGLERYKPKINLCTDTIFTSLPSPFTLTLPLYRLT